MPKQPRRTPQELTDLHITESSGVDRPAHQVEGWMVLKNREPLSDDQLADILSAATVPVAKQSNLHPVAKHDTGTGKTPPPTGAPGSGANGGPADPSATTATGSYEGSDYAECIKVSVEQDGMSPEEAAVYCRATTAGAGGAQVNDQNAEQQVTKHDSPPEPPKPQPPAEAPTEVSGDAELLKALAEHDVPEPIRKAITDSIQRANEAEAMAKAERETRVNGEWVEFSKSYRTLSADPNTLGPVLKRLYERSPEDFNVVQEVLKSAEAALRHSDLFREVGSSAVPTTSEPQGTIEAMAKSRAQEKGIGYEKALNEVLDTPEGREAYAQYVADREVR